MMNLKRFLIYEPRVKEDDRNWTPFSGFAHILSRIVERGQDGGGIDARGDASSLLYWPRALTVRFQNNVKEKRLHTVPQ